MDWLMEMALVLQTGLLLGSELADLWEMRKAKTKGLTLVDP